MSSVELRINTSIPFEQRDVIPKYTLQLNGKQIGFLIAFFEPGMGWHAFDCQIKHEFRRRGLATLLIRQFVEDVGDGQPVYGYISHKPTLKVLYQQGFGKLLQQHGVNKEDLTKEEFAQLPIVRMLRAGGIDVRRFQFKFYDPKGKTYFQKYDGEYFGVTDWGLLNNLPR